MVFSSTTFLFAFLPIVLIGYVLVWRTGLRNLWLLAMSILFYAWGEPVWVVVMLASILGNYVFGLLVHGYRDRLKAARIVVAVSVAFNLGMLAWFKYSNFFVDSINPVLAAIHGEGIALAKVHLPIGISFFTFQAMSYVIDVHRKEGAVQKNPINIALYISMFPQLIAGPIVRFHDVAKQIHHRVVTVSDFAYGAQRFIIGLGKKVLIANVVAAPADHIFGLAAGEVTTPLAWIAVICYSLQIYYDFSGYSDMAIGLGRMFGFHYLENFNYPYISKTITEFWRRWHISLSTWFRDYLYIPMGGNRVRAGRVYFNLVVVFFLCGLWHGASWNFVIWGLFHGAFLVVERVGHKRLNFRFPALVKHLYALLVVMVGWVFFRAETLPESLGMLRALVGAAPEASRLYYPSLYVTREVAVTMVIGIIGSMPILPWLGAKLRMALARKDDSPSTTWMETGLSMVAIILLFLVFGYSIVHLSASTYNPFIYFRF